MLKSLKIHFIFVTPPYKEEVERNLKPGDYSEKFNILKQFPVNIKANTGQGV